MVAKELMRREVFTIREDATVNDLVDLMVREHIHGCPVINAEGSLVGVVTQQDVFLGGATRGSGGGDSPTTVEDVMTSPAVFAAEDTEIMVLCDMMLRLRIHRIPIVHEGQVTGMISSLDIIGEWSRERAEK